MNLKGKEYIGYSLEGNVLLEMYPFTLENLYRSVDIIEILSHEYGTGFVEMQRITQDTIGGYSMHSNFNLYN